MYHQPDLGPDSLLWRWAGDNRIGLLGGTIGLLQLMHPAIGAGVLEHSDFFADPFDRVFRSLPAILGVVYDGPDAVDTGRAVRDRHRSIKGFDANERRYHALDPETFWWAHATFQFMVEQVVDRFDPHRLSPAEREQLYQEGVEWYRRYGVTDRPVPPSVDAFHRKWGTHCREVLEMTTAARRVLDLLFDARASQLGSIPRWVRPVLRVGVARRIGMHPVRLVTIGGLPAVVRRRFGIPWTRRDQIELDAIELAVRTGWRFVPFPLRWQPRALAGWRRVRSAVAA